MRAGPVTIISILKLNKLSHESQNIHPKGSRWVWTWQQSQGRILPTTVLYPEFP